VSKPQPLPAACFLRHCDHDLRARPVTNHYGQDRTRRDLRERPFEAGEEIRDDIVEFGGCGTVELKGAPVRRTRGGIREVGHGGCLGPAFLSKRRGKLAIQGQDVGTDAGGFGLHDGLVDVG
jgi:hypothetical protein